VGGREDEEEVGMLAVNMRQKMGTVKTVKLS
jgi:hypothetical protein